MVAIVSLRHRIKKKNSSVSKYIYKPTNEYKISFSYFFFHLHFGRLLFTTTAHTIAGNWAKIKYFIIWNWHTERKTSSFSSFPIIYTKQTHCGFCFSYIFYFLSFLLLFPLFSVFIFHTYIYAYYVHLSFCRFLFHCHSFKFIIMIIIIVISQSYYRKKKNEKQNNFFWFRLLHKNIIKYLHFAHKNIFSKAIHVLVCASLYSTCRSFVIILFWNIFRHL